MFKWPFGGDGQAKKTRPEPDPKSFFQRFGIWIIALILFALAVFTAIRYINKPPASLDRDAAGAVTALQHNDIYLAQPGDCIKELDQAGDATITKVDFVPCSQPHQVVAIGLTEIADVGSSEAAATAAGECTVIATDVTGSDPAESTDVYQLTIMPPGGQLRSYLCLVDYAPNEAPELAISQ
ncbi:MAG: septum formation family protein [Propionibacteriaceae bacterium]|jgi:hypothetical protein|nr:septum formation family protein [Propionibacteriaceae bacterium]